MGQTLLAAGAVGLALAGALAVGAAAAVRARAAMPHLGIAAVGAAAAALSGRLFGLPLPVVAIAVAALGAAGGAAAWLIDRAAEDATPRGLPLLSDVAVVGLALAMVSLVKAPGAVELPFGPLGGIPSPATGLVAGVVGLGAAAALVARFDPERDGGGGPGAVRWAVTTAALAVVVAVGAGGLSVGGQGLVPAFGIPDVIGLTLRSTAVAAVATLAPDRHRGVWLVSAAVVLGVAEALLRGFTAVGEGAVLPALVALGVAVAARHRRGEVAPAR